MLKVIYCVNRQQGMSVDAFQRYALEVHAPMTAAIPGLRRYVQAHKVQMTYNHEPHATYDAVGEMWFDDLEAIRSATRSAEATRALSDDAAFIDMNSIAQLVTTEHVILSER